MPNTADFDSGLEEQEVTGTYDGDVVWPGGDPPVGSTIYYDDALTVDGTGQTSGPDGEYQLWYFDPDTGLIYASDSYTIDTTVTPPSATTTFSAGEGKTTTTLAEGFDDYLTRDLDPVPSAGWQLITNTNEAVFFADGTGEAYGFAVVPVWVFDPTTGLLHHDIFDTEGMEQLDGGEPEPEETEARFAKLSLAFTIGF
jgi:hypothetical protein